MKEESSEGPQVDMESTMKVESPQDEAASDPPSGQENAASGTSTSAAEDSADFEMLEWMESEGDISDEQRQSLLRAAEEFDVATNFGGPATLELLGGCSKDSWKSWRCV